MSFLKYIFKTKETPIQNYEDFWKWFTANERTFYNVIKSGKRIEQDFFDKLSPKLGQLKDGFFLLCGMLDKNTAELILTPDGNIPNIVFVEELIAAAPRLPEWKFTALKPEMDIADVSINMSDYSFNGSNLAFYSIDNKKYPDEIDIVVVYDDYDDEYKATITNGIYIFLDNYLGELNAVTTIDNLTVISKDDAQQELIPISKLKDFLKWREKEFVEKYSGVRYDTENDGYSSIEAELESGSILLAVVNSTLLEWDRKASHPWILNIEVPYAGENGMPDDQTYQYLNRFEEEILQELKDSEGYLYIGRETGKNLREIHFACNDFRKPSKVLHDIIRKQSYDQEIVYTIYKDKYWQSFERFSIRPGI